MRQLMKKALLVAGLTLAPALPAMLGSPALAHDRGGISVSVSVPTPIAVFGLSYGNPAFAGHVHYGPVRCAAGPLYYYPRHRVYGHYHPRLQYHYYARPVYYAPPPGRYYGHPVPARWKQRDHRHRHHDRDHHDDDDN